MIFVMLAPFDFPLTPIAFASLSLVLLFALL